MSSVRPLGLTDYLPPPNKNDVAPELIYFFHPGGDKLLEVPPALNIGILLRFGDPD